MKHITLLRLPIFIGLLLGSLSSHAQLAFNELHYDNLGTDANERIEIAGVAGTDMTGWTVLLYNASAGTTYASLTLSGTLGNVCTASAINIGFRVIDVVAEMGTGSFQNNANSSMALVKPSGVCYQFLSYEGAGLLATNGACSGQTSTYIGAFENGTSGDVNGSIQKNSNGTWTTSLTTNTFGACNTSQSIVFPIELSSFEVKAQNDVVDITWSTRSEINNEYFNVERSADGLNFKSIGSVKGAGNSNSDRSYDFTDAQPLSGISYYRLQQVDYDGKFDYSAVRVVKNGMQNTVLISPNPVRKDIGLTNISYESNTESALNISVYNALGQVMLQKSVDVNKGSNQIQVDLSQLSKGVYTLHCQEGAGFVDVQQLLIK